MIIMGGSAKVNVPEGDGSAVDNNQEGSTDINNVNIPVVAGAFAAGNLFLSHSCLQSSPPSQSVQYFDTWLIRCSLHFAPDRTWLLRCQVLPKEKVPADAQSGRQ